MTLETGAPSPLSFDRAGFLSDFDSTLSQLESAAALGMQVGSKPIERLDFVGCGAPNQSVVFIRAGYFPLIMLARVGLHTGHAA